MSIKYINSDHLRSASGEALGYRAVTSLAIGALATSLIIISQGREIKRLRERTQQLEYAAHHDALTGLLNRRGFYEAVREKISHDPENPNLIVVYLDADNLRNLNNEYNHDVGDAGLRKIAELLEELTREGDILARNIAGRTGGDEFCLLLEVPRPSIDHETGASSPASIEEIIEATLKQRFSKSVEELGQNDPLRKVGFSFSVGAARYDPNSGETIEEVITRADEHVNIAKTHRNTWHS